MARLREAIGGAVRSARMASSAALFQSVTTSAFAGMPMLDARFMALIQAMKSVTLKRMFIGGSFLRMSAPVLRSSWLLCQDLFRAVASLHANASHSIGNDFLDLG